MDRFGTVRVASQRGSLAVSTARFSRHSLHDPQCLRAAEGIQANFNAAAPPCRGWSDPAERVEASVSRQLAWIHARLRDDCNVFGRFQQKNAPNLSLATACETFWRLWAMLVKVRETGKCFASTDHGRKAIGCDLNRGNLCFFCSYTQTSTVEIFAFKAARLSLWLSDLLNMAQVGLACGGDTF